jgi:hypothetical protein
MISPRIFPLECETLLVFKQRSPPVEILVEDAAAKPVVKLITQALIPSRLESIEHLPSI